MVRGRGLELSGKLGAATRRQLVRVQFELETRSASRAQYLAARGHAVHAGFAEDVREYRETLPRDARDHLVNDDVDVLAAPRCRVAIFDWNLVRAEKRRDQAHWKLL